jgi:uncharacterized protein YqjF (DUF2071 family)
VIASSAGPVEIDRLAPTRRPPGRPAGYQRWRQLAFVHWRVPVAALSRLVPPQLAIDTFDGEAFVGIVPFTMRGVRPRWAPAISAISDFHETNVRTYVHRDGADPGVWFFSLDAANRLAVALARTFWHLPYHHAQMTLVERDGEVRYASQRRRAERRTAKRRADGPMFQGTCRPLGAAAPAAPGTLEHFLAERYFLYAQAGGGELRRGQVHHAPYPLQPAELTRWDESLLAAAGIARPEAPPLVHYAAGVDVEVFALTPVRAALTPGRS